jgi:hypothetical protein
VNFRGSPEEEAPAAGKGISSPLACIEKVTAKEVYHGVADGSDRHGSPLWGDGGLFLFRLQEDASLRIQALPVGSEADGKKAPVCGEGGSQVGDRRPDTGIAACCRAGEVGFRRQRVVKKAR